MGLVHDELNISKETISGLMNTFIFTIIILNKYNLLKNLHCISGLPIKFT